jgi:tRNA(adenine34) deaminase
MPDAAVDLDAIPLAEHERFMRLAISHGRRNPAFPFGAVIVRAADLAVVAEGVNDSGAHPILHGEIAAMNDYVRRHGNRGWEGMVLYTTGEPCPMCTSAIIWAGIGGVVHGTSIATLKQVGFDQIDIPSETVAGAAPFWNGGLLGGVLAAETDRLFAERERPG